MTEHIPRDNDDHHLLWSLVIPYLSCPVPLPLSEPPRSALRQPHLACLSRVSKTFFELCTPLLWTTIVTDNLPNLITKIDYYALDSPSRYTKRILVEYMEKGGEGTYKQLLKDGQFWNRCGMTREEKAQWSIGDCYLEAGNMKGGMEDLLWMGLDRTFPNLQSIAISSIYGHRDTLWSAYKDTAAANDKCVKAEQAMKAFHDVLLAGSKIDVSIPLPAGVPVQWRSDYADLISLPQVINVVSVAINQHINARDSWSDRGKWRPVDLEVFASTARCEVEVITPDASKILRSLNLGKLKRADDPSYFILTPAQQKSLVEMNAGRMLDAMKESSRVRGESIKWNLQSDAPACRACGV
ncbi:uncharacterized protein MKK02DRAFT_41914 [Dioszegia hungarica]|uniref:Uncharacterized protein n=1 Tax=Dioszegia hungarica TaxID=4972 RepID=A0AA38HF92_9TREE|nr:uncharacterized protein MKK02DRAFT_41914 [Dioszegia hungarica]KAI9638887.1 hypothetical protein MKK02DRAFT_41914 [Dioszegia hungarica]